MKLTDDKFDGKHPNGINAGFTITTDSYPPIITGESCLFGKLRTTPVTNIVHDTNESCLFKTENSTYLIIK